jgi:mRNA interferase RelE/StbE
MRERSVRLPHDVQETIRSLHPELKRRVRLALDLLRTKPESGKELQGELARWRSLRVGRFRIVYREVRSAIEVAAIGPRASIYLETALRVARQRRRRRPRRKKTR